MGKSSTTPNMAKLKGLAAKPSAASRAVSGYEGDPEPGLDTLKTQAVSDQRVEEARSTPRGEYDDSNAARGPGAPPKKPRFTFIGSDVLDGGDFRPEWACTGVLVRKQPGVIAGPSKALKTNMAIDLAVSLASGGEFLGRFGVPSPMRVAVVSGESGEATLQETGRRICKAKGLTLADLKGRLQWCFNLPTFSDLAVMHEFARELVKLHAEVCIIDPVYLALGAIDAKNLFEAGAAFRLVAEVLLGAGCTPLLIHHANRQLTVGEPMELSHLAYTGLEQFARQFVLINRRERYKSDGTHDLWVRVGGSAGHGGLYDVRIEEGVVDENFAGRKWEVSVLTPSEVQADSIDKQEANRVERNRATMTAEEARVLEAIDAEVMKGQPGATRNQIRLRTGRGNAKIK